MANSATTAQKYYMATAAANGCRACLKLGYGESPAEIHHIRTNQLGERNHDMVIALCPLHHRIGKFAIHNMSREAWASYTGESEDEMCRNTRIELGFTTTDDSGI